MSAFYLYAITSRTGDMVAGRTGMEGAPLRSLPYREISAIVSALSTGRVEATPANIWLHEEIVEELMATSAVLPMRWGTVLSGERRIYEVLEAYSTSFLTALDQVRNRVELGLRVLWADAMLDSTPARPAWETVENSGPRSGTQYLMARVEAHRQAWHEQQRSLRLAEEIHCPLARLAAHSVREILRTPRMLLAAAYLVDRQQVDAVRAQVDALAAAFPVLRFLLTGPWPPYHFVTGCVPAEVLLPARSLLGGRAAEASEGCRDGSG